MIASMSRSLRPGLTPRIAARWPSALISTARRRGRESGGVLEDPIFAEQGAGVAETLGALLAEAIAAVEVRERGEQGEVQVGGVVEGEVDGLDAVEQGRETLGELTERVGSVGAVAVDRSLGADPAAAPDLSLGIAGLHKERELRFTPRSEEEDRAGLGEPGEIEEVAVRSEALLGVVGAGLERAAGEQERGAVADPRADPLAA
jgi:hypothetical protein